MQRRSCVSHVMIFSAFIKILQLKSDDWVVIILLCLGQHLIQHCVIIQRDEKGYGLTVTGDNPVYVQSVKEGLHDVYSFFCEERVFFRIHTHAHTKQHNRRPWKKNHEFQIEKLLDCEENVLLTLADKLHLFPPWILLKTGGWVFCESILQEIYAFLWIIPKLILSDCEFTWC